jgi:hypothetical protein
MVISPPRVRWVPGDDELDYTLAEEAIALSARAGLELDHPWQQDVLRASLALRSDRKWAYGEVGVCLPRQNGKNGVIEARQLAALHLFKEFGVPRSPDPLAVHTAHLNDTAAEAFRRLELLIEGLDELSRQVRRYSRANGKEAIEFKNGERVRYRARTKGGGRGYAGDDLYLDEAMFLPEFGYGSLKPILSARPNPQIWFTGSAVDREIHDDGVVFARCRERGVAGSDPRLAYFEWSLPYDSPQEVPDELLTDPQAWAEVNPALNLRILEESVESEQRSMAARSFIVERLGVGDWPDTDASNHVIDMELWAELKDFESQPGDPLQFAFSVSPDRSRASIAVAGRRSDGLVHVEVAMSDRGTGWLPNEVKRMVGTHTRLEPICDSRDAAASLVPDLTNLGVNVKTVNASEMAQACGRFFDSAEQRNLRHLHQPELVNALKGAAKRPLGDAWAWDRKNSSVDITPLVAATLALWGVESQPVPSMPSFSVL